jgi:hypothetical protein
MPGDLSLKWKSREWILTLDVKRGTRRLRLNLDWRLVEWVSTVASPPMMLYGYQIRRVHAAPSSPQFVVAPFA